MHGEYYKPLGTGFLLNKPGMIATAAHVVNGSDENLVLRLNNQYINGYQIPSFEEVLFLKLHIEAIDPLRDTCVLSCDLEAYRSYQISNTDHINPGGKVIVYGFPHSNTGRLVLTQQSCEIGAKILLNTSDIESKHAVLNIQARPGQSGSPVFNFSDGSLVGILIGAYVPLSNGGISLGGIDPQTLHQTTHIVSTEYLEGMIDL